MRKEAYGLSFEGLQTIAGSLILALSSVVGINSKQLTIDQSAGYIPFQKREQLAYSEFDKIPAPKFKTPHRRRLSKVVRVIH